MNKFDYALPSTVKDVFPLLKKKGAMIKAGGVDLLDLMKEGLLSPTRLVNIKDLKDLKFVREEADGTISIGPSLTLAEIAEHPVIQKKYKALAQVCGAVATPQIRHMATLAGNLCQYSRCWYYRNSDFQAVSPDSFDMLARSGENQYHSIFFNTDDKYSASAHPSSAACVITAYDANFTLTSAKGERVVNAEKFFTMPKANNPKANCLQPGELITKITLPKVSGNNTSFYHKQKHKQSFDWPLAEVAVSMDLAEGTGKNVRLCLGAAAPIPWRLEKVEKYLQGKKITKDVAKKAGEMAMKGATPLSKNAYKIKIFKTTIARTICWAAGIDPLK